jgi:methionyl-tRNA formyltransferase
VVVEHMFHVDDRNWGHLRLGILASDLGESHGGYRAGSEGQGCHRQASGTEVRKQVSLQQHVLHSLRTYFLAGQSSPIAGHSDERCLWRKYRSEESCYFAVLLGYIAVVCLVLEVFSRPAGESICYNAARVGKPPKHPYLESDMSTKPLRVVLMGTGPFAVPSFRQIHREGHVILAVVSRPPVEKPSRDKLPAEGPVMLWAKESGLSVHTPASINSEEMLVWLRGLEPDLLVVCDYGQILSREALGTARLGGINLHGSLLPRHRGAAPVQWTILAGDTFAGVSVIHMTPRLDAGPVIESVRTEICPGESAEELELRLSQLGVKPTLLSMERLADLHEGQSLPGVLQDQGLSTKAPRLSKSDGQLACGYSVALIDRQIRGLQPWPGVFGELQLANGKTVRMIVHRATPVEDPDQSIASRLKLARDDFPIGCIIFGATAQELGVAVGQPKQWVGVVVGDGILALDVVQIAGKGAMQAKDFVQGYGKQVGLRFQVSSDPHPLLERMAACATQSGGLPVAGEGKSG